MLPTSLVRSITSFTQKETCKLLDNLTCMHVWLQYDKGKDLVFYGLKGKEHLITSS